MTDNPKIHHRRSLRLKGYDYTQVGAYFVTIVLQDRLCLFGEIVNTGMQLSQAGEVARRVWEGLPDRFPTITIDTFVIMPNHLHGIIMIDQIPPVGAALVAAPTDAVEPNRAIRPNVAYRNRIAPMDAAEPNRAALVAAPTHAQSVHLQSALGDIIGAYKSLTTVEYTRGVKTMKWTPFRRRLWQRNYYEHIIRNEDALKHIRQYIISNPGQWDSDRENPRFH